MTVWVGTSGWQYADWRGDLYPQALKQAEWLEHYAQHFSTVEVNNAFYRLPERSVFESWRQRTPAHFVVTVKASRFLTHIRRLKEPQEPVSRLLDRAAGLGEKLGPVLLQLPPTMRVDCARLDETLSCFPRSVRVAVEPRHASWWTDDVARVLRRHGAALCWADRCSRPITPLWRTADWCYLRFHEGRGKPWPKYGDVTLGRWAERVGSAFAADEDVYAYFNNDPTGAAPRDAVRFARRLRSDGWEVPGAGRPADVGETSSWSPAWTRATPRPGTRSRSCR